MFHRCLLILLLLACTAVADEALPTLSQSTKTAALAGDWPTLRGTFNPQELEASPVARLLVGHAYLMGNRNNEALRMFLSVDEAGHRAWLDWTRTLPSSPASLYYQADAKVRMGDRAAALDHYNLALAEDGNFVPALLGKAMLLAGNEDKKGARKLLEKVIQFAPDLAEGHAALGQLQLLFHAATGAEQSFRAALAMEPDNALALNGLGCALYGLGRWEEAERLFAEAYKSLPLPLFIDNDRALAIADEDLNDGYKPGMQLSFSNGHVEFGDQLKYKRSLSAGEIASGQARMDYLYRPLANGLSAMEGPFKFAGEQWKNHLDQSTRTNQQALFERGIKPIEANPGGVTAEFRQAFVKESRWPVENDFGLAFPVARQAE